MGMEGWWKRLSQEAGANVGGTFQLSAPSEWNQEEEQVWGEQEDYPAWPLEASESE